MKFETGDIIVFNNGAFGHVAMCFDSGGNGEKTTFIHGTNSGNFHIDKQMQSLSGGVIGYMVDKNYWHFRPKEILPADKLRIKAVATAIAKQAKYGIYRAIRLFVGSSSFGKDAKSRLSKYKERLLGLGGDKLVTTITCSESVILCYQLTFEETSPYFIKKDAAHTMPRTLATYLKETPGSWETIKSP